MLPVRFEIGDLAAWSGLVAAIAFLTFVTIGI